MPNDNQRFTEHWDAVDPFDPEYPHLWIKAEHLGRYVFAANYLAEQGIEHVADIGCGTGYGSAELASVVKQITSVDADPFSLELTRQRTQTDVLETVQMDLNSDSLHDTFSGKQFDAVVCFETLEHLTDPGLTLKEFHDHIRPGGTVIISVPNGVAERVNLVGLLSNPFHRRMFSISSACELIHAAGLEVREVLGQPIAAEINRNETRLIRRKQADGRIGDEPSLHSPAVVRRLALSLAYPEPRDVERSYAIIIVAVRPADPA